MWSSECLHRTRFSKAQEAGCKCQTGTFGFIFKWMVLSDRPFKWVNKLFKDKFQFEPYLVDTPYSCLRYVTMFRSHNSRLSVEMGCWNRTELHLHRCTLCNCNFSIGEMYHYLIECTQIQNCFKVYLQDLPIYYHLSLSSILIPNKLSSFQVKIIDIKHFVPF